MNLFDINWSIFLPIIVISAALTLFAVVDCIRSTQTNGPKWMWLLIIVFVSTLGPVLYFVFGRRQH
jgi:hypothetical protein